MYEGIDSRVFPAAFDKIMFHDARPTLRALVVAMSTVNSYKHWRCFKDTIQGGKVFMQ